MFRPLATIPLQGQYRQESLSFVRNARGRLAVAWIEDTSDGAAALIATLEADQSPTISHLGTGVSGLSITPLSDNTFGVGRTRRRLFEVCILAEDGALSPFEPVHHSRGIGASVFPLAASALGVSFPPMFIAHRPGMGGTYIVAVTPDAWSAAGGALVNGEIVRVTAGTNDPYIHPPRYTLQGQRFDPNLRPAGKFSLTLPSRIIGNMYANPQQLVVQPLSRGGFVIAWTLVPHHFGSEIQFQRFDSTGEARGPIITAARSDLAAHIGRASLAEGSTRSLLVGWSRVHEQLTRTELVRVELGAGTVTALHRSDWRASCGDIAVVANQRGQTWMAEVALGALTIAVSD